MENVSIRKFKEAEFPNEVTKPQCQFEKRRQERIENRCKRLDTEIKEAEFPNDVTKPQCQFE